LRDLVAFRLLFRLSLCFFFFPVCVCLCRLAAVPACGHSLARWLACVCVRGTREENGARASCASVAARTRAAGVHVAIRVRRFVAYLRDIISTPSTKRPRPTVKTVGKNDSMTCRNDDKEGKFGAYSSCRVHQHPIPNPAYLFSCATK
jgi:hypothetical protein